jgi:hypothetical protein
MFDKFLACVGIVVGFVLCFLAVREFVMDKDALPMLWVLSAVLILSVGEVVPRHRQWQLPGRFERTLTLRSLGACRTLNPAHPY